MAASAGFTDGYRRYVLAVLLVVYTSNFIDRQILAILLPSIQKAFGLTDTELGFLGSTPFVLFYAILGIPIARLADRGSRRTIIALAVACWSLATMLCGAAQGFVQLILARVWVGIGEAGCSPPSHSLISDYFPAEKRGTALAIYALGVPIGVMFGFLVGGWLDQALGWHAAFLAVGLPGLALALLVRLTLAEPDRPVAPGGAPGVRDTFRALWAKPAFRHLAMAASLTSFVAYTAGNWLPVFVTRYFGMMPADRGLWLALVAGLGGGAGTYLGGWLGDRLGAHDRRWYMWLPAMGMLIAFPCLILGYGVAGRTLALLLFGLALLSQYLFLGPIFAMTQSLAPPRMRATGASLLLLIINLLGLGLGPLATGWLSDLFKPAFGEDALRAALLTATPLLLWSAWHYARAARTLAADLDR